jgi:hypothetical protein
VTARAESSTHPQPQIDAVAQVVKKRAWHPAAARYSYGFYYDAQRDTTVIKTDAPAEVMAPLLAQLPTAIEISYEKTPFKRDSRQSDPAPHWGGASITDGATHNCTSGFTVQNAFGTRYMVTAGHCFPFGAAVRSTGGGQSASTYEGSVYALGAQGAGLPVGGAADPVVGIPIYCRSGQVTFEQCNMFATSLNATACDANGCTENLVAYTGPAAGISAAGDSGAPIYLPGQRVQIAGIHIGRGDGSTMYAEKWSTIAARFQVSIVTG